MVKLVGQIFSVRSPTVSLYGVPKNRAICHRRANRKKSLILVPTVSIPKSNTASQERCPELRDGAQDAGAQLVQMLQTECLCPPQKPCAKNLMPGVTVVAGEVFGS